MMSLIHIHIAYSEPRCIPASRSGFPEQATDPPDPDQDKVLTKWTFSFIGTNQISPQGQK